jgi:hypothetical protein
MKRLFAFDWVLLSYLAIVTGIVLVMRPAGTWIYLLCHASAAGLVATVAWAEHRFGGRFWRFLRYWYVIPAILASYRELHYLVPQVHPFADQFWDRRLAAIDQRWFGNVDDFFLSGWPSPLVDLLYLCYWSYFGGMILIGSVLTAKGEYGRLREYLSVLLTGMYLSYLGYILFPAVGPHKFYVERPPQLNGWILGAWLHRGLMAAELEMPDAFPSGHTLMSLIVLFTAYRHHRPTFWILLLPATGCIIATMALRYHYVVDVVASLALLPLVLALGLGLEAWRERARAPALEETRASGA